MSGYRSTFAYRTNTPYEEPVERRRGYTEPHLTAAEHATVVGGVSLATACLARPLAKLDQLYFLSDVPGESTRIFLSDKRAQFFRVLFGTRWWAGPSLLAATADHVFFLGAFLGLREGLRRQHPGGGNGLHGAAAGALTGLGYAALHHPYDVLRATADAQVGRRFRGPLDVLRTALRERPAVLRQLYKGFGAAACGRVLQFTCALGTYNALRYDGVYRGTVVLFLYCQAGVFLGTLAQYPFLAARQQLHMRAALHPRAGRQSYRALFAEMRRRHGITKVFEGFFSAKPFLRAVPTALLLTGYDLGVRRYTEALHPERRAAAQPQQALGCVGESRLPAYEFVQAPRMREGIAAASE
ncbi:hypothetical protein STCU_07581 [Strigomonas culicis]|nr:hypothetical protein STCU_07581 [Strigomonas culicis]|eukprot:EPY23659.1 hypothetical protein STCU_07581 [Strigomonas culicis]